MLSALNPLQYLPVVGTIYRAVTGDVIPEPMRAMGSLVASGLLGGPVGMLLNLGTTALEKLTGIDPDHVAREAFAALGLVGPEPTAASVPAQDARERASPAFAEPVGRLMEAGDASDAARARRAADAYDKAQALAA